MLRGGAPLFVIHTEKISRYLVQQYESRFSVTFDIILPSLVVQWLGYMTLTHETRVQFPAREYVFSFTFGWRGNWSYMAFVP